MARGATKSAGTASEDYSSDSDAGASTSKAGALSTFVNPTSSLKSKRRRIERRKKGALEDDAWDPPLLAFPLLDRYEATERPRNARRAAYLDARRWLHDAAASAKDQRARPHIEGVMRSIRDVQERLSDQASRSVSYASIPVIDVAYAVSSAQLWSHLSETSSANSQAPWHVHVAGSSLTQDPRQVIAAACRQWLAGSFGDMPQSSLSPTALWRRLASKAGSFDSSSPLFILGLPALPASQLFSTLAYLRDSCEQAPQLLVVLQSGRGTGGVNSLPWEERRHLDVVKVGEAGPSNLGDHRSLLHNLFFDASNPPPVILPPQVVDLACRQTGPGDGIEASALAVVDLALQKMFAQNPAGAYLGTKSQLDTSDFTTDFFAEARQYIIQLLQPNGEADDPDVSLLPPSLQSGTAVRQLLQDDERLLAALPSLVRVTQTSLQERSMALEMLRRASQASPDQLSEQSIDSLGLLFLSKSADDLVKGAQLRKQLTDVLAPILRSVRRNESEEGGLTLTQLEEWLDSLEEWIGGVRPPGDETFLTNSVQKIMAFQQELRNSQIDAEPDSKEGDESSGNRESSRLSQVQKKLQREESLRGLRGRIADWFGSTVRTHLLQPIPPMMFTTATTGTDLAIAIESLLFPSPRQHITVGLSRPQLYLQHFSDVISTSSPVDDKTQTAIANLNKNTGHDELQTDLSRAFSMLREAGGPGTGVKGRMVNLYDWYQAWLVPSQDERTAQARFSLVLSTLALMGYIRKTRKGNGELVLKTGGWDVLPWSVEGQDGTVGKEERDADDVF